MFPTQIAILMAVEEAEQLTIKQLTYVTDVRGPALGYLCDSLDRYGYLEQNDSKGYCLTSEGKKVLSESVDEMELGFQASIET